MQGRNQIAGTGSAFSLYKMRKTRKFALLVVGHGAHIVTQDL